MTTSTTPATALTMDALLEQWQGHRRLTRKVIEAFPEDKLFGYSVGGMRPFAELAIELISLIVPGLQGVITGEWITFAEIAQAVKRPTTREDLLALWDTMTDELNILWPQITPDRFQAMEHAFDLYDAPNYWTVMYFIDNEIHHRGQGYVYLRSLGIEPPMFWER